MLTTHYTYAVQVRGSSGTLSKDLKSQLCNHAGTHLKPSGNQGLNSRNPDLKPNLDGIGAGLE